MSLSHRVLPVQTRIVQWVRARMGQWHSSTLSQSGFCHMLLTTAAFCAVVQGAVSYYTELGKWDESLCSQKLLWHKMPCHEMLLNGHSVWSCLPGSPALTDFKASHQHLQSSLQKALLKINWNLSKSLIHVIFFIYYTI